jgi:histidinol-phosphatase (PHP family)
MTIEPLTRAIFWDFDGTLATSSRTPAAVTRSVPLRLGLEADYFPETVEALRRRLAVHPFDFVIGSVHFVGRFPVDGDARLWQGLSAAGRDAVWRDDWRLVRQLAESGAFGREAYPSPALLRSAQRRGIPVLLSADAHAPHELTRHFAAAEVLAREAGYDDVVRYAGRERLTAPLSPAVRPDDGR